MASRTFQYFAYGSNMLTRRIVAAERAPSAKPMAIGYAECRRLTFNKVSRDGSGKCDAEATGRKTDRVYGVIFEIDLAEEAALDKEEGAGSGYAKEKIDVVADSGAVQVKTYIATKKELVLRPYHWYLALTIAGAVEHGLPTNYVEWVRTFESIEDPDAERRARNEGLLFAS